MSDYRPSLADRIISDLYGTGYCRSGTREVTAEIAEHVESWWDGPGWEWLQGLGLLHREDPKRDFVVYGRSSSAYVDAK